MARAVFHGKRGELRQQYREGQEDQLGALGLVLNMIVLWNSHQPIVGYMRRPKTWQRPEKKACGVTLSPYLPGTSGT